LTSRLSVTADNAVPLLLNQIYRTMTPSQQNAFYARAAGQIFRALASGQGNQLAAIRGLVRGVNEHRVFAWSGDPKLAKVIDAESLTGAFPSNTGSTPLVGIYLNDGVPGKQEFYLRQERSARATGCHSGVQQIQVEARFWSVMPPNAVTLTPWIVGTGEFVAKAHMYMTLYLAAPRRGSIDTVSVNGAPVTVTANQLKGRQLALVTLAIAPGKSVSVTATMRSGPGQTASGLLTWTPGMTSGADPASFASAC
jgi:hypothetical protein